mmetsp:Transcript_36993/g.115152  ORF Transcript_36993/g.115152 Transcript_36993/m.115152 type:complete len:247 (+) Transcript_36993:704-1444(+)
MGERLHTIMGGILLQLVVLIIHSYILEQAHNSRKAGTLPSDPFWYAVGNVTNQVCTLMTIATAPILFWNEGSPTSIAMDSLTILFIFMLDDFAGHAVTYMGKTEEGYSRSAAWHKGLLAHCPVSLSDLINPSAASADELWCIRYSPSGDLLKAGPQDGSREQTCPRRLERLRPEPAGERTALVNSPKEGEPEVRLWYTNAPGVAREMPGQYVKVIQWIWSAIGKLSLAVQVTLPVLWMVVNKPCHR